MKSCLILPTWRAGRQCSKAEGLLGETPRGPRLGSFAATLAREGLCPPFSLFLLRSKLSSIFFMSISYTSGQALCGFLGSVLRRIGCSSKHNFSGRWFWLWLKDTFELDLRKYFGKLSVI